MVYRNRHEERQTLDAATIGDEKHQVETVLGGDVDFSTLRHLSITAESFCGDLILDELQSW